MASKKVSELDAIDAALDADLLFVSHDGASNQITKAKFLTSYNNTATGSKPAVFGVNQTSNGNYNTAIGSEQSEFGNYNTIIGAYNTIGESGHHINNSTALGVGNTTLNYASTIVGTNNYNPYSYGSGSVTIGNGNHTTSSGVTNIGSSNTVSGNRAVAIGRENTCTDGSAIAAGYKVTASGYASVGMGYNLSATGNYSVAIGPYNNAEAESAITIGTSSTTHGTHSTVIGGENYIPSSGSHGTTIGWNNTSNFYNDITVGKNNTNESLAPYSTQNIGVGTFNTSKGYGNIAIGNRQGAYGIGSVCIGGGYVNASDTSFRNYARGYIGGEFIPDVPEFPSAYNDAPHASRTAIAIGQKNLSVGPGTITMGYENTCFGFGNIALGWHNTAYLTEPVPQMANVSIGFKNTSGGYFGCTAVGAYNVASYATSCITSIGNQNIANATYATAIGTNNLASANSTTSVGYGNTAISSNGTAMGSHCIANNNQSTAIGYQSQSAANYANAIGYKANARIAGTTNIRGPIIVAKDNDDSPMFIHFNGVENILMTGVADLTQTTSFTINIPDGSWFYVDEVGIIANQMDTITGQPTISFGYTGSTSAFVSATATTLNSPGDRNVFSPVSYLNAVTTLVATINSAATATTMNARFYFKGMLIENQ